MEAAAPGQGLEAELAHLGAVAAASIADVGTGSLLDKALELAEQKAEAERAQAREQARADGYREGMDAAQREAQLAWEERLERVARLADGLNELRQQVLAEAEDKLLELVFEAVTRILGESLLQREGAAAVVRQVLASARDQDRTLTIRVSPADYALLGGNEDSPPKIFRPGVAIVADSRVQLGGCLVDTAQGTIDGRLEVQIERLKNAILEAREAQRK